MTRRRWRFGGGRVSVQGAEMPVLLWEPRPVPPLGVIPQEPWPEREADELRAVAAALIAIADCLTPAATTPAHRSET